MQIKLIRSGGFAGQELECELDTSRLEPDKLESLGELLAQCKKLNLNGCELFEEHARDAYIYDLSIVDGGKNEHFIFDDNKMPAAFRSLTKFLLSLNDQS